MTNNPDAFWAAHARDPATARVFAGACACVCVSLCVCAVRLLGYSAVGEREDREGGGRRRRCDAAGCGAGVSLEERASGLV